jgi:hypothetical protein
MEQFHNESPFLCLVEEEEMDATGSSERNISLVLSGINRFIGI